MLKSKKVSFSPNISFSSRRFNPSAISLQFRTFYSSRISLLSLVSFSSSFLIKQKPFSSLQYNTLLFPIRSSKLWFSTEQKTPTETNSNKKLISVTFVTKEGKEITVKEPEGTSLLEVAHKHDIDLEGACEGSLACSTCHVIVLDPKVYESLPEPTDEENDMLDLAFGLTATSRLGCQILLTPELDGKLKVALPAATRNMAVDGYKPPKH